MQEIAVDLVYSHKIKRNDDLIIMQNGLSFIIACCEDIYGPLLIKKK